MPKILSPHQARTGERAAGHEKVLGVFARYPVVITDNCHQRECRLGLRTGGSKIINTLSFGRLLLLWSLNLRDALDKRLPFLIYLSILSRLGAPPFLSKSYSFGKAQFHPYVGYYHAVETPKRYSQDKKHLSQKVYIYVPFLSFGILLC